MFARLRRQRQAIARMRRWLATDQNPHWQAIRADQDQAIAVAAAAETADRELTLEALLVYFTQRVRSLLNEMDAAQQVFIRFQALWSKAPSLREKQRLMLEYCQNFADSRAQVRGDERAMRRFLDEEALIERHQARIGRCNSELDYLFDRLGVLGPDWLAEEGQAGWRRLGMAPVLRRFLEWQGDQRVRSSAFIAFARLVAALPANGRSEALGDQGLQFVSRACLDPGVSIEVQIASFELLFEISREDFDLVTERRLRHDAGGEDFFVRVAILFLLARRGVTRQRHLELALADGSAHVRTRAAQMLWRLPGELAASVMERFAADEQACVRIALMDRLSRLHANGVSLERLLAVTRQRLLTEDNATALAAVMRAVRSLLDVHSGTQWQAPPNIDLQAIESQLVALRQASGQVVIRRQATRLLNDLWLFAEQGRYRAYCEVSRLVSHTRIGRRVRLSSPALHKLPVDDQLRLLTLVNRQAHPLSLRVKHGRVVSMRRGEHFGFRLWRWWYELRRPATDKRQAYRHTKGRVYHDLHLASGGAMAELSQTQVPGEPLYLEEEGDGRPFLPLLDQALSALDQGWPTRSLRLASEEGITEVEPPSGLLARLRARITLSHRFAEIAELRNWRERAEEGSPADYVQALQALGFTVRLVPYRLRNGVPTPSDPSVARFFPAMLPLPLVEGFGRLWQHFLSVYQNSLWHLSVFIAAVMLVFFGRHAVQNRSVARARSRVPLVIGGWGTRGKSGTERLKAALFASRGLSMICKTTGCEAMWLYARPFQPIRELFLFRPYDKATIWEQGFVTRLAARTRVSVLLWECMGLTPDYVRVLRDWMRDDLSTITNAYPDHEDVQGPAGYDIPTVMQNFIPKRSTLFTTEEQMLPILREGAERVKTAVEAIDHQATQLIAPDVLQRFPYEEHPSNIALVLALAERLGFHQDEALRAMTRFVVPDLGVLKTFPTTRVSGRELTFVMGMSANERFAALSNWRRMRFDQISLAREPERFVVAVVNNRADRVPRSQVFAQMLVDDLSVDAAVLIGTNVSGLVGFIENAWQERIEALTPESDADKARQKLEEIRQFLRLPASDAELESRMQALLARVTQQPSGPGEDVQASLTRVADPDLRQALGDWFQRQRALLQGYAALLQESPSNERWQAYCRQAMAAKLVRVDNSQLDGNAVNRVVAQAVPPGADARVMGLQNIKGTGLDFVYRWVAWEECARACEAIATNHPPKVREGLAQLMQMASFNLLMLEPVQRALNQAGHSACSQEERVRADIEVLQARWQRDHERLTAEKPDSDQAGGATSRWLAWVEQLLDAGDAIKRRKQANRIYKDLINERVGSGRAADELLRLTKRQKGGWLMH